MGGTQGWFPESFSLPLLVLPSLHHQPLLSCNSLFLAQAARLTVHAHHQHGGVSSAWWPGRAVRKAASKEPQWLSCFLLLSCSDVLWLESKTSSALYTCHDLVPPTPGKEAKAFVMRTRSTRNSPKSTLSLQPLGNSDTSDVPRTPET